jgi:hypothetical protein
MSVKSKVEKQERSRLSHNLRLAILMMLLTSSMGCAALGLPSPVDLGDFPPCPGLTDDEVSSIRALTKYDDPKLQMPNDDKHKEVRDILIARDQNIINVLGRVGQWCQAYHERIGYQISEVPIPEASDVPVVPGD